MSALAARIHRGLNAEPEQQMLDLAHHLLRCQREAGTPVNVTVAHPEDGEEPGKLLVGYLKNTRRDLFDVSSLVAHAMAIQELSGQQKRLASGGIALGDANPVTMSEPRRL